MSTEYVAIIDIGTNTFHLVLAEINEREEFFIREKYKEPVKLGEGGITTGLIAPEAFVRGIRALQKFRKIIDGKNASRIYAFATSAVRGAGNAAEFIQEAREKSGIEIRVINGNEEASLIYEGVRNGVHLPYDRPSLLVDIGGGSVEFIVNRENKPLLIRSMDIGAARLLELFKPSDPIRPLEMEQVRKYIRTQLNGLVREIMDFKPVLMVGSSGTFETLGNLVAADKSDALAISNLNNYKLNRTQFQKVFTQILKADRSERLAMPGMEPMRVDMIPMGALVVDYLLKELDIKEIIISTQALKEGILYRYIDDRRERMHHLLGNADRNTRTKGIRNLAKKFQCDLEHGLRVSEIGCTLFDELFPLHRLGDIEKDLLRYAAVVHDIGYYISRSGHHKHGQYIVMNCGLPGFSSDELVIMSNIVRYHRKSLPSRDHFHFKILAQEHRNLVRLLSGILRIADNLDRGHRGMITKVKCDIREREVLIYCHGKDNIDMEISFAMENRELLEQVLERPVRIIRAK